MTMLDLALDTPSPSAFSSCRPTTRSPALACESPHDLDYGLASVVVLGLLVLYLVLALLHPERF